MIFSGFIFMLFLVHIEWDVPKLKAPGVTLLIRRLYSMHVGHTFYDQRAPWGLELQFVYF